MTRIKYQIPPCVFTVNHLDRNTEAAVSFRKRWKRLHISCLKVVFFHHVLNSFILMNNLHNRVDEMNMQTLFPVNDEQHKIITV